MEGWRVMDPSDTFLCALSERVARFGGLKLWLSALDSQAQGQQTLRILPFSQRWPGAFVALDFARCVGGGLLGDR